MFGYVVVNKPELKFREFDVYRAYYCGLCHSLSKRHGLSGQLTLSYDMTFLVILLSSLYEPEHNVTSKRCVVHPLRRQNIISSEFTDYVADMNVILSYFKCLDDWHDDRSVLKLAYSKLLKKGSIGKNLKSDYSTTESTTKCDSYSLNQTSTRECDSNLLNHTSTGECDLNLLNHTPTHECDSNSYFTDDSGHLHISPDYSYKDKINAISSLLDELGTREKMNETNVDVVAGLFGKIMQILFVPFDDIYAKGLGRMGFYLGKFIYIMDAFDDVEEDVKKGRYNVFSNCYTDPDFETRIKDMLTMMMAECSDAFEMLPAVDNADILRNILYSGVWNSYERRVAKNLERE